MNRRLRHCRLSRMCWAFVLATGFWLACAVKWTFAGPLGIATGRALESLHPPWSFETDQLRFFGTVAEPLCRPPRGVERLTFNYRSVANCVVHDGTVRLTLREDLRRIDQPAASLTWTDVQDAVGPVARRSGLVLVDSEGQPLTHSSGGPFLHPDEPVVPTLYNVMVRLGEEGAIILEAYRPDQPGKKIDGAFLQVALAGLPVAWSGDAGCPVGTGPFRIARVVYGDAQRREAAARGQDLVPCGAESAIAVPDWSWDQVRLRGGATNDERILDFFSPRREEDYATALTHESVHLVLLAGHDALVEPEWTRFTRNKWVLYAVASPTKFPGGAPGLVSLARRALEPRLFSEVNLVPTPFLVPPEIAVLETPFKPVLGDEGYRAGPIRLQSNDGSDRRQRVERFQKGLHRLGVETQYEPDSPPIDAQKRRTGDYHLSFLSVTPVFSDAGLHVGGLTEAWFKWGTEAVIQCPTQGEDEFSEATVHECGSHLAERSVALAVAASDQAKEDLRQDLTALLGTLSQWMVPVGRPTTYDFRHNDVIGFQEATGWLDPARIGLRDAPRIPTWVWAVLIALLGLAVAAIGYARSQAARQAALRRRMAGFHHDLSSPIATIRARSSLLARVDGAATASGEIHELADQALQLIDRNELVLAGGKVVDTGGESQAIADGFAPAVRQLRSEVPEEDQTRIQITSTEGDALVSLSPVDMRRLAANLCSNALKFRGSEPLRLVVHVAVDDSFVRVTVSDWGIGIDEDLKDTDVFRPYKRGGAVEARGIPGLGLGLYVARDLAWRAGGRLRVQQRREPTVFVLTLPRQAG